MLFGKNSTKMACVLLAAAGLSLYATSASATVISPTNGSFENPTFGGWYTFDAPTGWDASAGQYSSQVIHHPGESGFYAATTDGVSIFGLEHNNPNGFNGIGDNSGIQQDLGTMEANRKYTFNATLFSNSGGADNLSAYRISFYDVTDGRELAAITEANYDPSSLGTLKTLAATFDYTTTAADVGDTLRLIMEGRSRDSVNYPRTGIDSVTVTTSTVPEPNTLVLLTVGLASLLAYAWRKQKCVPS